MTKKEIFQILKEKLEEILVEENLQNEKVVVSLKTLSAKEAIGETKRQDYPIITGKEVMLQAKYKNSFGQAFTDAPWNFTGSLGEICQLNLEEDAYARSVFIATLNAVMCELKRSDRSLHCKGNGPEHCAKEGVKYIEEIYGNPKIALVGYQPAMLSALSEKFKLRVLDLNRENIGKIKNGILVEDGDKKFNEVIDWADLILCTGSTLCNGTVVNYLGLEKEVLFFGTTMSGAAPLLGAKRLCFSEENFD